MTQKCAFCKFYFADKLLCLHIATLIVHFVEKEFVIVDCVVNFVFLCQWRGKMIQEGRALVKGCSKSDAIWASFMGSFAILGAPAPLAYAYVCHLCYYNCFPFIVGERFERGIQDAVILESDEALVVVAQEEFDDVTQDGKRQ